MSTREEQIKKLSEELLALLNTANEIVPEKEIKGLLTDNGFKVEELDKINVNAVIVKKIMQRVDEVYGACNNYIFTEPLYEVLPNDKP